jgi:hypothetical protein
MGRNNEGQSDMNTSMRFPAIQSAPDDQGFAFHEVITLKRIVAISAALIAFALVALGVSTAEGATLRGWNTSFAAGQAIASETGRPLLVIIVHEGCPACADYESELSKPSSIRALRNAVKVQAESSYNPELVSRYASRGTPTTVLFSADTGFSNPVFVQTGVLDSGDIKSLGRSINSLR